MERLVKEKNGSIDTAVFLDDSITNVFDVAVTLSYNRHQDEENAFPKKHTVAVWLDPIRYEVEGLWQPIKNGVDDSYGSKFKNLRKMFDDGFHVNSFEELQPIQDELYKE